MTTNQKTVGQVRELALEVLIEVLEKGGYSHKCINGALKKYQYLEKQDRAFFSRLCEGTIEHAIELDYIINQFSKVKVKKQKPVIRNILRMAVYQIKYMDAVPDSAACNEAVKLATKKGFGTLKGFVNGVLRNISRNLEEVKYPDVTKEPMEYLHIRYSMPIWIVKHWLVEYDFSTVEAMLEQFMAPKVTTIRTNLNKMNTEELAEQVAAAGITVTPGAYLPYALKISGYNYIGKIPGFEEGQFVIQDESSMLVGEVAGVQKGMTVIDVCAAPGGKSLHVAEKLEGTGKVFSRDLTYEKTALIEENKNRLGVTNVTIQTMDALELDEESVEMADVVIADLPCSGLGVIGKKPDIKYKMEEQQLHDLAALQRDILRTVTRYVKPGGTMVYSTCTINKEENLNNAKWIASNFGFELESLDPYIPESMHSETTKQGYLQLLPGKHKTDGFFIAKLKKC